MNISGRQDSKADHRASVSSSRSKTPDRSDCPSTFRATHAVPKLPVFPLDSSSPPSSPPLSKADKEGREGEKKRSQQQGQPLAGSKSAASLGGGRAQREQRAQGRGLCNGKGLLSEAQVRLLVGLHYLPHEHGPSAQKLLQDLTWLKSNCHLVGANSKKPQPQKVIHDISFLSSYKRKNITDEHHCVFPGVLRLMSGVGEPPDSYLYVKT